MSNSFSLRRRFVLPEVRYKPAISTVPIGIGARWAVGLPLATRFSVGIWLVESTPEKPREMVGGIMKISVSLVRSERVIEGNYVLSYIPP